MLLFFLCILGLAASTLGQWNPNYVKGRAGMVQLFEWNWDTIAEECETFLSLNKFGGVQISPPNENAIILNPYHPWYERYQSVSYKLVTRSGNRTQFASMVKRCNKVGVRIYPDVIINHMCSSLLGKGYGTAGSFYDTTTERYDGVPYSHLDFNDARCYSKSGGIDDRGDINQIRNCQLVALQDLNMGKEYVRKKIIDYLNDLISLGVAGFRVDACNHMWPGDLKVIFDALDDLPTEHGFEPGTRPYIQQEVIARPYEPVNPLEYYPLGQLTEFNYALEIDKNRNKIQYLKTLSQDWGLYPSEKALVFLNNHDNQRRDDRYIDFNQFYDLKIFTAFMMAWPYGLPRIMSSYRYNHADDGPPGKQRSVNVDGSCGNGWVCEHRWRQIKNMPAFAVAAEGEPVINWWTNMDNQIAFSRGRKAFLAINKAWHDMDVVLNVGLPEGYYCDVVSGNYVSGKCSGKCIYVNGSSQARITILPTSDPFVALHVDAPCSNQIRDVCTGCDSCSKKIKCGHEVSQKQCEELDCLWCPDIRGNDPWCIHNTSVAPATSNIRFPSCAIQDGDKEECGFIGIDESRCLIEGCCWAKTTFLNVPWCYQLA